MHIRFVPRGSSALQVHNQFLSKVAKLSRYPDIDGAGRCAVRMLGPDRLRILDSRVARRRK